MMNYLRELRYSDVDGWRGTFIVSPYYSMVRTPFNYADRLIASNLALNNLLIQRDKTSISRNIGKNTITTPGPSNLSWATDRRRNEFTEYNCNFDLNNAEGGDISFDGEAIEAVAVRRSSNRSNYFVWEDIAYLPVTGGSLYTLDAEIYDPYIEHGITYQYAIQPIGAIGRGTQYETLKYTGIYDDIWLIGDDETHLMMGYNPNVSNYKYVVKEAAIETIGSKYPYVVRNANVGYSTFNYSCTITAHMNEIQGQEIFTPFKDIQVLDEYKYYSKPDQPTGSSSDNGGLVERPKPTKSTLTKTLTKEELSELMGPDAKGVSCYIDDPAVYDAKDRRVIVLPFNTEYEVMDPASGRNYYKIKILDEQIPSEITKANALPKDFTIATWGDLTYKVKSNPGPDGRPGTEDDYDEFILDANGMPVIESMEPYRYIVGYIEKKYVKPFYTKSEMSEQEYLLRRNAGSLSEQEFTDRLRAVRYQEQTETEEFVAQENNSMLTEGGTSVSADREFMLEREFRRRVIDFLHNGKPKVFKSPTEGLLLVRLSDISFTPNTQLGRLIYDFSCTMTEIAKVTTDNLARYGFRQSLGDIPLFTTPTTEKTEKMSEEEVNDLYELLRN